MTIQMEEIAGKLAELYRRYSYEDKARHFESLEALIIEADGSPAVQKEIARNVLGDYRGMDSLNDQLIMVDGKIDHEASSQLDRLMGDLRSVATDIATRRTG